MSTSDFFVYISPCNMKMRMKISSCIFQITTLFLVWVYSNKADFSCSSDMTYENSTHETSRYNNVYFLYGDERSQEFRSKNYVTMSARIPWKKLRLPQKNQFFLKLSLVSIPFCKTQSAIKVIHKSNSI